MLQIVGLDAAVVCRLDIHTIDITRILTIHNNIQLLSFLKMSFWLFSSCSIFAIAVLMPINLKVAFLPLPSTVQTSSVCVEQY